MIGNFIQLTPEDNPAIFSREKDSKASAKYSLVHTDEMISALEPLGWRPFEYHKVKRNMRGLAGGRSRNTAKHMVKLRNINDEKALTNQEGCGEITIINSHDTTSTVLFAVGWLEFICSNGLISMKEGSYFKLRHVSITTQKVVETVTKLAAQFPQISEDRERYLSTKMTELDAFEFAKEAGKLRFRDSLNFNYADLLKSRYQEQQEMNLWNVFNNVQRNLFAGGFHVTDKARENKMRKVRKINSIDANVELNGRLWNLLEQFGERLA